MKDYYGLADGKDVLAMMPPDERYIFAKWNVVKYVVRAGKKTDDVFDDLGKAGSYLKVMMSTQMELERAAGQNCGEKALSADK